MFNADTRALGSMAVQDVNGSPITFGSAWANQPVIFVFLRHFG